MFRNLAAEMARQNITIKDISLQLHLSEKTIKNYLSGKTRIPWNAVVEIKKSFFPEFEVSYLFDAA